MRNCTESGRRVFKDTSLLVRILMHTTARSLHMMGCVSTECRKSQKLQTKLDVIRYDWVRSTDHTDKIRPGSAWKHVEIRSRAPPIPAFGVGLMCEMCGAIGDGQNYWKEDHALVCLMARVACPSRQYGCDATLQRKDIALHLKNECAVAIQCLIYDCEGRQEARNGE